ncbi:MAG: sulfite exporter TauE/SafE family protein [Phycisphaerales bacterium]|jgi:uncharacterized protein|nr:sulfite exporter TauE/SafE family protein [Phycisphaerales bacterium]MBT7170594.1 sulfite exporter TauE/SafE family protein [Phycisphaerales bacterium]
MDELLQWINVAPDGLILPMAWACALMAVAGVGVGIASSIFGVGGGFLVVPMLYLLGMPYGLVTGTSICSIVGTTASGVVTHHREGNVCTRTMWILGLGAMLGGAGGKALQLAYERAYPATSEWVLGVGCVLVLLALSALVFFKPHRPEGKSFMQRISLGWRVDLPAARIEGVALLGLIAIGLSGGLMAGLFGLGGGAIFVPLMLLLVGMDMKTTVGTKLGVILMGALATTAYSAYQGQVCLPLAMSVLVGSSVGVQLGIRIVRILPEGSHRRGFAILIASSALAMAAKLIYKALTG